MTALIVDDEPLARAHLRRLLEAQGVQIVGEAESAASALQMAEDLRPVLLLLDIQMPGLAGMQMASAVLQLKPAPLIIFVTAYSEHAAAAFEQGALDYLMKPVSAERLAQALVRARGHLAGVRVRGDTRRWVSDETTKAPPLRRLPVRGDYVVHLIRVEEVVCAVSRDKRVIVRARSGEYRTYYTLTQLEALLPGEQFMRIHDSCLVNLEEIKELLFLGNHGYEVRLSDNERLPVGRRRCPELRRRLGLEPAEKISPREIISLES
jgi:DNA-binding LytR/AlgR family response regulator